FLGTIIQVALSVVLSARFRTAVGGCLAALAVSSAGLVLAQTRGAWIATTIVATLQIAWMRAWVPATWAGMALLLALLAVPPEMLERIRSIVEFTADPSASNRLFLWPQVIGLIADQPLTGYGFGSLAVEQATGSYHAHNVFLDFAVTLGVPALLAFLTLVAYVLGRAFATVRRSRRSMDCDLLTGLWATTLCILLAGRFDGSILIWPILAHTFWLLLALTFSLAASIERESARPAGAHANVLRRSP